MRCSESECGVYGRDERKLAQRKACLRVEMETQVRLSRTPLRSHKISTVAFHAGIMKKQFRNRPSAGATH
ncbi:uncharacterized [Tachysurus ichikawai]